MTGTPYGGRLGGGFNPYGSFGPATTPVFGAYTTDTPQGVQSASLGAANQQNAQQAASLGGMSTANQQQAQQASPFGRAGLAGLMRSQGFEEGGRIEGPGTGTSDSIPAMIYQDGVPVQEARLSTNEVVLSNKDLANIDPNKDVESAATKVGNAENGSRGQIIAKMYNDLQKMKRGQ